MATIKSEVTDFFSGALSWGKDKVGEFSNWISGTVNQVSSQVGSLIVGSVVGINVNKVPEMTGAIETEVAALEKHLEEVNVNTDPSLAFADEGMQQACRAYIGGVMEACKAYTSQLLKLADTLDEVKTYYETNQAKQSETLTGAGTEAASSVERYTRGSGVNS